MMQQYESEVLYILKNKKIFEKEHIFYFLRDIYGIGFVRSRKLLLLSGVTKNFNIKVKSLNDNNKFYYRAQAKVFKSSMILGGLLKSRRRLIMNFMQDIKIYKGIRYYYNLPMRGQRTHSNGSYKSRWRSYL